MKIGDLVEHVKTGQTGLLIRLWESGHQKGVVEVLIGDANTMPEGAGFHDAVCRWFRSSCKVICASQRYS